MGVTIGFEDELQNMEDTSEFSEQKKQEIVTKAKVVLIKIPEKRKEEVLRGFDCVVVNTFDDDYHSTDEEREQHNRFAKDANKIRKMKRIYRRLDEYIIAVREHLKFLDKVAEGNGVYDPEEFKKMFFKGKINIVGMRFPKYKGPNRKDVNYKYLAEFALSGADPSEIIPKWQRDDYEDDDPQQLIKELFTDDELKFIFSPLTKEEARYEYELFDENEDDQDGIPVGVTMTNKDTKKLVKAQPELVAKLKEIKREKNTINKLNDAFLHNTIVEDIDEISRYEANYGFVSKADVPEFKGDVFSSKDYNKYMQKLKDYEDNNIYTNYHGKDKSLGEIKELELKEILEQDGWNIRNFAENKMQEKRMKKLQKRDNKKIKQVKRHLMAIEKRRKSRIEGDESYKDFKKKKKKKVKDKAKKKEMKSNVKKDLNNILMAKANVKEETFKEYEERALDLTGLFGDE